MPLQKKPAKPVRVKLRIKKGDLVQVTTGARQERGGDRGKTGRVIQVFPERQRVLVEGINRITKHVKAGATARGSRTGGIETHEAPIHISNVQVVCPRCDRPTRIGHAELEGGRRTRVCKRCGEQIEVTTK